MKPVHQTVSLQVVAYLKLHIKNGDWPIGSKIPSEHTLTQLLSVSRASVRSALQQLIAIGVLESVHGKGSFVRSQSFSAFTDPNHITPQDCTDLRLVLEFRRILEPEACAMAARNTSSTLLQLLIASLEQMKKSVGDPEQFVLEDRLFHQAIAQASGNHLLEKSLRDIFENTTQDHLRINQIFGYSDGIYHHTMILDALQRGEARLAKKWMHQHLQQAVDRLSEKP